MKPNHKRGPELFLIAALLAASTLLLISCGEGGDTTVAASYNSGDTGTVAFNVVWDGKEEDVTSDAHTLQTCTGINFVSGDILSQDGTHLAGETWPCNDHRGTIDDVPVGSGLWLVVQGKNGDEIVYYGEKTNIQVSSGQTTDAGKITGSSFVPALSAPSDNGTTSGSHVTLQWSVVTGAKDYYVVVATDDSFNNIVDDGVTINNFYTPANLDTSTTYYWYVATRNHANEYSVDSDTWQFTTGESDTADTTPTTLTAPQNVYAVPDDGEVTLSWSAVDGAQGYRIYYRTESSPDTIQEITADNSEVIVLNSTATLYVHQGLTNGIIYSHALTAFNGSTESDFSDRVTKIPAWGNEYEPDRWEGDWVSAYLGEAPLVSDRDGDWYMFEFNQDNVRVNIECQFIHQNGDIDMALYNVYGYEDALAASENDNEFIEFDATESGLYYIQVFTTPGVSNTYDLRWTTSPL